MQSILYVDDERENLIVFETIFRKFYHVLTALSVAEAKAILETREIDLLLTDQKMPNESGTQLLIFAAQHYPSIERILITGYTELDTIVEAVNQAKVFYYVTKPWDPKELRIIIERALEVRALRMENQKLILELKESNKKLLEKNIYLAEASEEIDH